MYTCTKVYNTGESIVSQFDSEDKVDEWLRFNIRYFVHCPLFVNGVCKYIGHFSKEKILLIQERL